MAGWRGATVAAAVALAVAVILLAVCAVTVFQIVRDPSGRLSGLQAGINVTTTGPNASFTWVAHDYTVTFTDTSTDNGSAITQWAWEFGDGTYANVQDPPAHMYTSECGRCTVTVDLAVQDAKGFQSAASAQVVIQSAGEASGVSQSGSSQLHLPSVSGTLVGVLTGVELLVIMVLIAVAAAKAGWNLLRRDPEPVAVPFLDRAGPRA